MLMMSREESPAGLLVFLLSEHRGTVVYCSDSDVLSVLLRQDLERWGLAGSIWPAQLFVLGSAKLMIDLLEYCGTEVVE